MIRQGIAGRFVFNAQSIIPLAWLGLFTSSTQLDPGQIDDAGRVVADDHETRPARVVALHWGPLAIGLAWRQKW